MESKPRRPLDREPGLLESVRKMVLQMQEPLRRWVPIDKKRLFFDEPGEEPLDARDRFNRIGYFEAKKPFPWWKSQKHRTSRGLLPSSILRDSYLKDSIYPSPNRGARKSGVDMASSALIRHSTVTFTSSQQTFKINDRSSPQPSRLDVNNLTVEPISFPQIVSKAFVILSQLSRAEKHFNYGHREGLAPWPYRTPRLMK